MRGRLSGTVIIGLALATMCLWRDTDWWKAGKVATTLGYHHNA